MGDILLILIKMEWIRGKMKNDYGCGYCHDVIVL